MKLCPKCGFTKDNSAFSKSNLIKNSGKCKDCVKDYNKIYTKEYYKKNSVSLQHKHKKYREENKEKIKDIKNNYLNKNPNYHKNYRKLNSELLKEKKKIYVRRQYKNNINFKLRIITSGSNGRILKNNKSSKNNKSILQYLSYTMQELKDHLQSQFEPWMSWNNWGKYNKDTWDDHNTLTWTWQIDHIIPQSILPYISMEDTNFKKCWALDNLRPLSAKQNLLEGNRRAA